MTEHFNQYFTSIGRAFKIVLHQKKHFLGYFQDRKHRFFIQPTAAEEVKNSISKSTGHNGIPTILLKQARNTIFLTSGKTNLKPESFLTCKLAKVVPVFTSETRLFCNSYRPISRLSNIGKIIEKLIHDEKTNSVFFLERCNCYYPFQVGFRSNYSINSALSSIVESIQA